MEFRNSSTSDEVDIRLSGNMVCWTAKVGPHKFPNLLPFIESMVGLCQWGRQPRAQGLDFLK